VEGWRCPLYRGKISIRQLAGDRVLVEPLSGGWAGTGIDSAEGGLMRTWRPTAAETATLLACVVLGGALAVCVVFGPAWLAGPAPSLTAAERLSAENDVRSTLLQGLGGFLALGGVAFGAVVTLRQVRASSEGRSIDLFTKAIDQLASDQVSVRHGGVYALEQLSELDARYRGHAHALLTAFVRQHVPWPAVKPDSEVLADRARLPGGLPDDVGAAMAVLGRQAMIVGDAPSELERVDLRGAELAGLNLPRVCFAHANLDGAILRGADLSNAKLQHAHLAGAIADNTTKWPQSFTPPQTHT
jgi:hypothetical protein